jgi:hypothetical protein
METPAPYHTAPKPPRNLAAPIAAWLREQGFTATERQYVTMATVGATWLGPSGERFELGYFWVPRYASATLQLQVRWPGKESENLFGSQQVRRLREVRWLLRSNVRYANARLLAGPVPAPTGY